MTRRSHERRTEKCRLSTNRLDLNHLERRLDQPRCYQKLSLHGRENGGRLGRKGNGGQEWHDGKRKGGKTRARASGRRKAEAESEGCASLAGWSGGAEKMIEFVLEPEKGQERVRYLSTTSLTWFLKSVIRAWFPRSIIFTISTYISRVIGMGGPLSS